jgi:hypothetical protein
MTTREMREDVTAERWLSLAGLTVMTLGLVACESEHAHYFHRHVNHVSQDAVARRWGPPHRVHELSNGDVVWAYESGSRSHCTAHVLRFDRAQVLRDWNERKC